MLVLLHCCYFYNSPSYWKVTVVMMGQMSLDDWVKNCEKKNDQDQADGIRQKVYFKGNIHNEMSDL